MICTNCKKYFTTGNRPDGIPNGVKMLLKGGKSITMCAGCMISIGKMSNGERDSFIEELKKKADGAGE